MQRITQKNLDSLVDQINTKTNSPMKSWTRNGKEGKRKPGFKANIGNYHLNYAYGGVELCRIVNDGGGIETISSDGFSTKRELYSWIRAFLAGITV